MDELNLFRDFRSEAAPARWEARRRASARLADVIDLERSLEHAVDERPARVGIVRWAMKRPAYVGLASVALIGAAATALFLNTPWKASPGFLERAAAALPTPKGRILHMKTELTTTSTDPPCTVTFRPDESWADQTPPYRFRYTYTTPDVPPSEIDTRVLVCAGGKQEEVGGPVNARLVEFVPPNTLVNVSPFSPNHPSFLPLTQNQTHAPDPVTTLRAAIRTGRAHDEGSTTLHGSKVERIRIDPSPTGCIPCPPQPLYVYVDPDTFYPVEVRGVADLNLDGVHVVRVELNIRYLTYEYLPRTAANLALTNIRAQHPNACLKDFWGPGSKPAC